jgi:hypothetical protein
VAQTTSQRYPQPVDCPTCHHALTVTELSCGTCGTRVSGTFRRCEFCGLDDDQRALLRVFLATRGNVKEIERFLGVSYPTARARLDDLIGAVGANETPPQAALSAQPQAALSAQPQASAPRDRHAILDQVAVGTLDVGEALQLLAGR